MSIYYERWDYSVHKGRQRGTSQEEGLAPARRIQATAGASRSS
jgi:hypothetical protein